MVSLPAVPIVETPTGKLALNASDRYGIELQTELRRHLKKGFVRVDISGPDSPKRARQVRAYYALEGTYWGSGLASDPGYTEFHTRLKVLYGAGAVPVDIGGVQYMAVKSIRKYTLKEMTSLISGIISEGELAGIRGTDQWGPRWEEIIIGMRGD